ncbi:MAG: BspA family leucine-rich repeat surface protein, partial [Acutalibacteraceae bacterium]
STPKLTIGMIKIDDNVIIPTADGLLNTTTNQLLVKTNDKITYQYINNTPPIILDNLIKSVDVQPKIDVVKYGIKLAFSTFTEVPEIFDFSNISNMRSMFQDCGSLQTIPAINTSNVTDMGSMFQSCGSLQTIPLIDTSNVTNMANMFYLCSSLRTIPLIDTSNVADMGNMFADTNIETLPELDTRNVTSMNGFLRKYGGMQNLTSLPKFNVPKLGNIGTYFYYSQVTLNNLTEVGGWENLKCNWNDNSGLICLPNLTYQSCINILNGLYDFTGNGETPASNQGKLKVHPNFLTTVGDEISIGTNKNWTITA